LAIFVDEVDYRDRSFANEGSKLNEMIAGLLQVAVENVITPQGGESFRLRRNRPRPLCVAEAPGFPAGSVTFSG